MEREIFDLPPFEVPPDPPVTPEELERRNKLFERTIALREKNGNIGLTWEELMADEDEEGDGNSISEPSGHPQRNR